MTENDPSDRDFQSAVSQAAQAVAEQKAAQDEAAEKQKPKPRGPILAVCLVVLGLVLVYDVIALNAVPEGLPEAEVTESLRFTVGTLAEEVELFNAQEGRLPTLSDLQAEELLDEGMTYQLDGDTYTITATDEVVSVTYRSTTPLAAWVNGGAQ